MIATFVVTLREGVEAALVIAIAVAYVKRIGRLDLMPAIYRGLLTAVVASFIAAWGFAKINLNDDAYEGFVYLISAASTPSRNVTTKVGIIEATQLQFDCTREHGSIWSGFGSGF